MKFLLTNDDGIDAAGLEALVTAVRPLGDPVVVAPARPQSGVSHAVTWQEGVRIEPRGEKRFAIHGTPADCTRLGLLHLVPDANWILSGINHGANLGADVYYSGTVAAVREAVLHGWPGIAVSYYRKTGIEFDWERAARWVTPVLSEVIARRVEPGLFYNVNLPLLPRDAADPEVVWCPLDPKPLPLNYRHEETSGLYYAGDYNLRHRTPEADVDNCFRGRIAVTLVRLL
ncbi:MAG: 5'/3'-nucleotidase SurE [Gemmatimonadaceae bacterium]|nr:5'/3'-nucleotidase SurE [Gemmatimonadaceae bacterium]MDQ3314887.1 5'/3'-nucleotidase SurE [Verrucomicrobiota bacterium]